MIEHAYQAQPYRADHADAQGRHGLQDAKVGTQPTRIVVRRTTIPPSVGQRVTFRRAGPGTRWVRGMVTAVNPDGYLFIDRVLAERAWP